MYYSQKFGIWQYNSRMKMSWPTYLTKYYKHIMQHWSSRMLPSFKQGRGKQD